MQSYFLVAGWIHWLPLYRRIVEREDVLCVDVVDKEEPAAHLSFFESDIEKFSARMNGHYDEVYHLAPPASPCWYMSDPARTIWANVLGAFRLRELMGPKGLSCFTSNSEVYGDPLVLPNPKPIGTPYSRSRS